LKAELKLKLNWLAEIVGSARWPPLYQSPTFCLWI